VRGDPRRPAEVLREAESVAARIEYSTAALLATDLGDAEVAEVAEVRGLSKTYDGLCDALDLTTKINRTGVIPDGGVLMHGDGSGRASSDGAPGHRAPGALHGRGGLLRPRRLVARQRGRRRPKAFDIVLGVRR
jgi:hypothetical protein